MNILEFTELYRSQLRNRPRIFSHAFVNREDHLALRKEIRTSNFVLRDVPLGMPDIGDFYLYGIKIRIGDIRGEEKILFVDAK